MIRNRFPAGLLVGALIALAAAGCGKKHDDSGTVGPVDESELPPVPTGLALEVGSGHVTLRWTVGDPTGVSEYRVYRAVGFEGEFALRASVAETRFVDGEVTDGTYYRYQVAAVKSSLEGRRSGIVQAIPNVFSVVLEGGAEVTSGNNLEFGSRRILVDLLAPDYTLSWSVSEDSTFAGAPLRPFNPDLPTGQFVLSPGDGVKTVYGRFTGEGGVVSEIVSSRIRLDTRALILAVTEDSSDGVLVVNDVLHVTLQADTTGGAATVDIGDVFSNLRLFDDGTRGDVVALDAVYERDFVVTAGLEAVEAVITGRFRDDVGNDASPVFSATKVTIADPPGPVAFSPLSATSVVGATATLFWSPSSAADFAEYRIYQSEPWAPPETDPGVTEDDLLVGVIDQRAETVLVVSGLEAAQRYTYGAVVVDENGFRSTLGSITIGVFPPIGYDPVLTAASFTPPSGNPSTTFLFSVTYSHPAGLAPGAVTLVLDGNLLVPMPQTSGGTDWVGGEDFRVGTSLGPGEHVWSIVAVDSDGAQSRIPADPDDVFLGPTVSN